MERKTDYKLNVDRFSRKKIEGIEKQVEPLYKAGDVEYYDQVPPVPTEIPRHTLLPMSEIGDWVKDYVEVYNEDPNNKKKKEIGWKVDPEQEQIVNPKYGSAQHYAEVKYDEDGNLVDFVSDGILLENGPLDERTGIATPGSVVAPIEKREDGYYVHCFYQWRPAPWDAEVKVPEELTDPKDIEQFKALNTGEWFLTVPGGFAKFAGNSLEDVAAEEALEESGLRIRRPKFKAKSFNRANVRSQIGIGFAEFERIDNGIVDQGEKLLGKFAVRIDKFRSKDSMSSEAVNFAREELDLISSGKQ